MVLYDSIDDKQPVYTISVAAELCGMHPQTLRVYEQKGLVSPGRSKGNTRLYSKADVRQVQLINELTNEGINLAGVMRILDLRERAQERDEEIDALRSKVRQLADTIHDLKTKIRIDELMMLPKSAMNKQLLLLSGDELNEGTNDER